MLHSDLVFQGFPMQVDLGGADRKLAWDPSFARSALGGASTCFSPLPAPGYAAVLVLIRFGQRSFAARRASLLLLVIYGAYHA